MKIQTIGEFVRYFKESERLTCESCGRVLNLSTGMVFYVITGQRNLCILNLKGIVKSIKAYDSANNTKYYPIIRRVLIGELGLNEKFRDIK